MFATLSTKVLLTIYPLSEFNCLANSCIQWVGSVPHLKVTVTVKETDKPLQRN